MRGPISDHRDSPGCLRARCVRCLPAGASPGLLGLPQFGPCEGVERVGDGALAFVGGVQVDQCGAGAGVAHPGHEFAQVGSGVDGQVVPGMPEIVEVHAGEPGGLECGKPDAAADVPVPQRLAAAALKTRPSSPGIEERAEGTGSAFEQQPYRASGCDLTASAPLYAVACLLVRTECPTPSCHLGR